MSERRMTAFGVRKGYQDQWATEKLRDRAGEDFDRWLAQHDRDVRAEVRESLAADLGRMSEQSHHTTEYSAGLSHAAALVRPKRRIESQETP